MILEESTAFIGKTFAKSTQESYKTHLRQYIRFCIRFNLTPVPADQNTILSYIAFLARTLKPSSISNYINIIRILHLDAGLPNPLQNNFQVTNLRKVLLDIWVVPPNKNCQLHVRYLRKYTTGCVCLCQPILCFGQHVSLDFLDF